MIPLLTLSRTREIQADFGHGLEVRQDGRHKAVGAPRAREFTGRFHVAGESEGANLKVKVAAGFVNGREATWNGRPLGEMALEDYITGAGPYVCLRITVDAAGKAESMEAVCSPTIGGRERVWLHPLALFSQYGKVAQLAWHDYKHSARALSGGRWAHFMVAA